MEDLKTEKIKKKTTPQSIFLMQMVCKFLTEKGN